MCCMQTAVDRDFYIQHLSQLQCHEKEVKQDPQAKRGIVANCRTKVFHNKL